MDSKSLAMFYHLCFGNLLCGFCAFLFDWWEEDMPKNTWESLVQAVQASNAKQEPVWNPMTCQLEAWVDLDKYHQVSA